VRWQLKSSRFPYVPIRIDLRGRSYEVEALLDTGFDGHAALPEGLIPSSEAPDGSIDGELADGSVLPVAYYVGSVAVAELDAQPCLVMAMGNEPLIGRAVTDNFTVILDHGRQIILEE